MLEKITNNFICFDLIAFNDKYQFDDEIEAQDVEKFIECTNKRQIKEGKTVAVKIEENGISRYFLALMAKTLPPFGSRKPHSTAKIELNGKVQTVFRDQVFPLKSPLSQEKKIKFSECIVEEAKRTPCIRWDDRCLVLTDSPEGQIAKTLSPEQSIFNYLIEQNAYNGFKQYQIGIYKLYTNKALKKFKQDEADLLGRQAVKLAVALRSLTNEDLLLTYKKQNKKISTQFFRAANIIKFTTPAQEKCKITFDIFNREIERRGLD